MGDHEGEQLSTVIDSVRTEQACRVKSSSQHAGTIQQPVQHG